MRCPKCQYIGYGETDRCRHCGYDLSAAAASPEPDIPMLDTIVEGPPSDFDLQAPGGGRRAAPRGSGSGFDLPLFHEPVPGVDDTPLIKAPASPRAPLSVRRSTETPRARSSMTPLPAAPSFEFPAEEIVEDQEEEAPPPPRVRAGPGRPPRTARRQEVPGAASAPIGRRAVAGMVDLAMMAGLDLLVVALTLRLTGLEWSHVGELPLLPLAGFFAILNGGYLVGFTTAAGQTLGKMLTGVRIVGEATQRVPLGAAVVRAAAFVLSVLPAGLGLLPVLLSADGRALHDRLAGTRVTRA
jgi:uncharacterized RDD family membrane protein YckC